MFSYRVELDLPVPQAHQEEVLKNLRWIDPGLEGLAFAADSERVLCCAHRRGDVPADVQARLKATAERIARSLASLPVRTVWQSDGVGLHPCADAYEQLCGLGWVVPLGPGYHAYAGLMYDLYRALDDLFRQRALNRGAAEYRFPTLVSVAALRQAGYFDSFPHHANFVCHLPEQAEAIAEFRARLAGADPAERTATGPGEWTAETALAPTVCYQFYQARQGCVLEDGLNAATGLSNCYRYEGRGLSGLRRLREFSMREIVFLGDEPRVQTARQGLLDLLAEMLEFCELRGCIQTAGDPFFVDAYAEKRLFQVGFDLKQEAQAWLPGEESGLAIGSVNYHRDFFGTRFGIRLRSGEPARSCCLGFGIDRWCLAILAQHGLRVAAWPDRLRNLLSTAAAGLPAGGLREA